MGDSNVRRGEVTMWKKETRDPATIAGDIRDKLAALVEAMNDADRAGMQIDFNICKKDTNKTGNFHLSLCNITRTEKL